MKRKTGSRIFNLTSSLKKLGHGLGRRSRQSIAHQVVNDEVMLSKALVYISNKVKKEIKYMCSYHVNSVLRKSTIEAMQSFKWEDLTAELTAHAPTFYKLLNCCIVNKHSRKPVYSEEAIIGNIAAIFLRYSNQRMNMAQRLNSVVLYSGHSAKQVSKLNFYLLT